jgi:hypothetical protein
VNGKTAETPCLIGAMNATTFPGNLREVLNGEVTPDHDREVRHPTCRTTNDFPDSVSDGGSQRDAQGMPRWPADSTTMLITAAELEASWPLTGVSVAGTMQAYRDRAVLRVHADQGTFAAKVAADPRPPWHNDLSVLDYLAGRRFPHAPGSCTPGTGTGSPAQAIGSPA